MKRQFIHPMRLPVISFALFILLGGILLWLPPATTAPISFIDALFTSTSATCVTGLAVVDTGTRFTLFGQCVLIALMEVGGLGIMTFSTILLLVAGGKAIGAVIYFTQVEHLPLFQRIFFAVFHSVSAFCNAGFSTLSTGLVEYQSNWIFNLNTCILIVSGGIGFITLSEIFRMRTRESFRRSRLSLHSKLAIITSAILIVVGTLAILFFEWNDTLLDKPLGTRILASLFQSVTTRTAGFNTLDIGLLSAPTIFFMIILMYIGGSPGSTAGGIKTTTGAVLASLGFNRFLGREKTQILNRTIPQEIVDTATRLFIVTISLVTFATLIITTIETWNLNATESHPIFIKAFFESVSAFATCGLSMNFTPTLTDASKLVLIALMFIGRLGPLGIITAVAKPSSERAWYAEEQIMIG
jgi:trk system potassium uptake protein TrkH